MTNRESGEKLIREAERIFARDLRAARDDSDHNMTVRRAQEVVELLLKGVLKVLGIDYPKVHDVGEVFVQRAREKFLDADKKVLKKVLIISRWLGEARAPSFYCERVYNEEDALKAYEDAEFVLQTIKNLL